MIQRTLLVALATTALLLVSPAHAEDCLPASYDARVKRNANVVIGEVERLVGKGKQAAYRVRVVTLLKRGSLFPKGKSHFDFPKFHDWQTFQFKPGQLILFFFHKRFGDVSCNEPIVLK